MSTIIKIEKNTAGFHDVETRSHNYIPEGFLLVPPELTDKLNDGWCSLTIEEDILTSVVPEEKPPEEKTEEEDG